MCSTNNQSIWSSYALCSFEIGGECNVNTNECDCINGYSHDLLLFRHRDCSVPPYLMPVAFCILITTGIMTLISIYRKIKSSISTAKKIIINAFLCEFFLITCLITYIVSDYAFNAVPMMILYVSTLFLEAGIYLCFYSLASPLFKMAEVSIDRFVMILWILYLVFRCFHLSACIACSVLYNDHTNPDNDYGWNIFSSLAFILYGAEQSISNVVMIIVGNLMVKYIEELVQRTPENPNHQITKVYVEKVKEFLKQSITLTLIFAGVEFIIAIIQLSTGYIIFSYIGVIIMYFMFTASTYAMSNYATPTVASASQQMTGETNHNKVEGITVPQETTNHVPYDNLNGLSIYLTSYVDDSKATSSGDEE